MKKLLILTVTTVLLSTSNLFSNCPPGWGFATIRLTDALNCTWDVDLCYTCDNDANESNIIRPYEFRYVSGLNCMSPEKNSMDAQLITWLSEQCNPASCLLGPCKHYVLEYPLCWRLHSVAVLNDNQELVWLNSIIVCSELNSYCQTHAYLCTDTNGFKIDCGQRFNSILGTCQQEPIEFPPNPPTELGEEYNSNCFIYHCN